MVISENTSRHRQLDLISEAPWRSPAPACYLRGAPPAVGGTRGRVGLRGIDLFTTIPTAAASAAAAPPCRPLPCLLSPRAARGLGTGLGCFPSDTSLSRLFTIFSERWGARRARRLINV